MREDLIVLPTLFTLVVAPLWLILHYSFRFKVAKSLSRADEETLAEARHRFRHLESRLRRLERHVTSERFELDRQFSDLENNA